MTATGADVFVAAAQHRSTELFPGCHGRFVHGENITIAHWRLAAGAEIPLHDHPHEQAVNLLTGSFEVRVGDDTYLMSPGDTVVIPGGVPHSARAITEVRCIDIFHPVREDYRL